MSENKLPYGYCQCGCGQKTKIAKRNSTHHGYVKGEPIRFIAGHGNGAPVSSRFWKYVTPGKPNECWLWRGHTSSNGYGRIGTYKTNGGMTYAHRFSYELHYGPIPEGMLVCHTCDVRLCCNPSHLFLGTSADNLGDMATKGRSTTGERNAQAKLTKAKVKEIRAHGEQGIAQDEIARRFGVHQSAISKIIRRERWKHVP